MKIRSRVTNAYITFRYYARTSTIHGLLHTFQSTSKLRQGFWICLGILGFSFGLYHLIITTQKYIDSPVNAQLKLKHERAKFPCVTICSLKPVSEALYHFYTPLIQYLSQDWGNFTNWINIEHLQYFIDDASQENFERFRRRLNQVHQVMWVSGDTRDLGIYDNTTILYCKFNDIECNYSHFTLIQHYQFWNCYTFDPHDVIDAAQWRLKGHQLDMILTINAHDKLHLEKNPYNHTCTKDILYDPRKVKDPLYCVYVFCPNQMIHNKGIPVSGIRIFIHQREDYPMSSKEFVDIQLGKSSTITLNPLRRKLLSRISLKCRDSQHMSKINYTRYFGVIDAKNFEYRMTETEFIYEEKQIIVFTKCKCYSHRYPFTSSIRNQLCYYAPPEQWKTPSNVVLRSIQCHDDAVEDADNRTAELVHNHLNKTSCEQLRYRPSMLSLSWPKFEYIKNIWADLFLPKILNGIEFTESDIKSHHIFNVTRFKSLKKEWLSRETMELTEVLFSNDCEESLYELFPRFKMLPINQLVNLGWCIERRSLSKNMAQLSIKLPSPWTDVYEETHRYEWTEAVSEIGGTLGLWIGISLMVIVELLELIIVVIVSFVSNQRLGETDLTLAIAESKESETTGNKDVE